jgi:hypothetical protein
VPRYLANEKDTRIKSTRPVSLALRLYSEVPHNHR